MMYPDSVAGRSARRAIWAALVVLVTCVFAAPAAAQQRELTAADRLAILYAPQLNFTPDGDPIIRVAIKQGADKVEFTPSEAIRVLPQGEGGPEVDLPGGKTYTVTISHARPGAYKHWVVVDSLPVARQKRVAQVEQEWTRRGYLPESFEVGGLFGIRGKVFDSRQVLVAVGGTGDLGKAHKLKRKLEAKYGIVGRIHSEVTRYPSGTISLTGQGIDVAIKNPSVLWVSPQKGHDEKIRYKVPGIKKDYRPGTETRTYLGKLIFAPDKNGKLVAMVSLGAERLLRGVVPSEIYASAPQAALRAQAVAARNEIFAAIGVRNLADPFMQRADVFDQVYRGVGAEDSRSTEAVQATRGQVMFYGNQIIEAVYSSNAGGFTENNDNVWDVEARPYLRGKADAPSGTVPKEFRDGISASEIDDFLNSDMPANSKNAPVGSTKYYRWTDSASADQVQTWLSKHGYALGTLRKAKVTSRGVSGRVIRLKLTGTKASAVIERELNVRRLFGGLKSGLFLMKYQTDAHGNITRFSFRGAGFGHGVGMCQTGATGMASRGKSFKEILTHYYSGIDIRKLY